MPQPFHSVAIDGGRQVTLVVFQGYSAWRLLRCFVWQKTKVLDNKIVVLSGMIRNLQLFLICRFFLYYSLNSYLDAILSLVFW